MLPKEQIKQAMQYVIPDISMAKIVTGTSTDYLADIGYTLLATLGLFGVTLLISSFTFKRAIASQLEMTSVKSNKQIEFVQNSPLKSFYLKDLREIIRNPGFAFYCFFQVIMAPIMILFFGIAMPAEASADPTGKAVLEGMTLFMTLMLVSGINYVALSSISREGPNFNMSKALPAPYRLQAKAKVLLADTVLAAGLLLSFIASVAAVGINIIQAVLFVGFALIYGNAVNHLMLHSDARNPKLEWENITMAVKNSKGAFIGMFMSMGVGIVFMLAYVLMQSLSGVAQIIGFAVVWIIFYTLALILNVTFRKQCFNNIEKLVMQQE